MSDFLLKYENVAEVGDMIKAYDFKPCSDRKEQYVIGRVKAKGTVNIQGGSFKAYTIEVIEDTVFPAGARQEIYVPMQTGFDFNERITLVDNEVA